MLRGVFAHTLAIFENNDRSKGPIEERLVSTLGGSVNLLDYPPSKRAAIKSSAWLHNQYHGDPEEPVFSRNRKEAKLRWTNDDLPPAVQDPPGLIDNKGITSI